MDRTQLAHRIQYSFYCDEESDIIDLPPKANEAKDTYTGSSAFVIGSGNVYVCNSQGDWILI